ncbi:uncharacterized protein SPPG_00522 [Spizellomyces punctatus DAOM BR117]|uniref:Uncharacterized protein n=1 Tax=Spizellomyces punctatus (strain DAOM BR117) TaxID=645134 RepID=A0A0L0HVB7_SPIPD|nr:uncharacterized protein SPPG_00522 [Spizellomyces punctatus DAOM BR117]KND04819.1 hypothetical protein SPPG_00522 [Spizellomyces punctatus DAOM BR117]|eukprot:XP_016612858.1 hypothetical protein SPPG_00522 [Spizellomyces punctatus DAOM BR117]
MLTTEVSPPTEGQVTNPQLVRVAASLPSKEENASVESFQTAPSTFSATEPDGDSRTGGADDTLEYTIPEEQVKQSEEADSHGGETGPTSEDQLTETITAGGANEPPVDETAEANDKSADKPSEEVHGEPLKEEAREGLPEEKEQATVAAGRKTPRKEPVTTTPAASSAATKEGHTSSNRRRSTPRPRKAADDKMPKAEPTEASTTEPTQADEQPEGDAGPDDKQKPTKPYVNRKRHETGGADKKRLTGEELEKKMQEMKRKNAEIIKKQQAVEADEQAWRAAETERRKKEDEERERQFAETRAARQVAKQRREEADAIQQTLRREREENAARKAQLRGTREWDLDKEEVKQDPDRRRDNGWGRPRESHRGGRGRGGNRRHMDRRSGGHERHERDMNLESSSGWQERAREERADAEGPPPDWGPNREMSKWGDAV